MSQILIRRMPQQYPAPRYICGVDSPDECNDVEISGFASTQAMLTWIHQHWAQHGEYYTLVGYWEIDDAGSKWEFDGEEVYAGCSWEEFKADHVERLREAEEDNRAWREEIAREEGRLNGMASYNDWMGY